MSLRDDNGSEMNSNGAITCVTGSQIKTNLLAQQDLHNSLITRKPNHTNLICVQQQQ